jgi:hypothetical protein
MLLSSNWLPGVLLLYL